MTKLPKDLQGLAALFVTSGTLHLVRPQFFETIVPRQLRAPRALVHASGVAELVGLLHPRTRKAAGWASGPTAGPAAGAGTLRPSRVFRCRFR